jgi:hypothetical protein
MPFNPAAVPYTRACGHRYCDWPPCEAMFDTREFTVTCVAAPLQIEGSVDGVSFYFRARHGKWRLEAGTHSQGEVIAAGDTDDFTIGQAVDLITAEMAKWIWAA